MEALKNTEDLHESVIRLSQGTIEKVTRLGPTIARDTPRRRLRKSTFTPQLNLTDRIIVAALSLCWALCLLDFWVWWLEPVHQNSTLGSVLNAIVLLYLTGFPIFFVVAVNRLRNVRSDLGVPPLRAALVVTRAPSEPWEVAKATLTAMLHQDFPQPYDVCLADESPTSEILEWCVTNGVIVSTRNGIAEYHRKSWPRR